MDIITQPQTFKNASTVMGAAAGLSAVSGLTVYGDISASGNIYGRTAVPVSTTYTFNGNVSAFAIGGFTNTSASNYLVYLDGVHQVPVIDYSLSATSGGGNVILTSRPANGVVANVISFQSPVAALSATSNIYVSSEGGSSSGNVSNLTFSKGLLAQVVAGTATIQLPEAVGGQILTYNGITNTWVASGAPSAGSSNLWSPRLTIGSGFSAASTGELTVNGTIRATGDVIAFYTSDGRLKDNVTEITNALDKVSNIRGVEYEWNTQLQNVYSGDDVGVIAQEVEKVLPTAVVTREDGYKAVKYEKIIPLLIEAIKDLKSEIQMLKDK